MVMLRHILLLIILSASNSTNADTLKSLDISSSDLVIDRQKTTASFTGNVVLCFQDIKVLGNKAIFYFEDDKLNKIKSIKVQNNVKAKQKDGSIILADEAIFELDLYELKLNGHVIIEKGENIMHSKEMILYRKIRHIILGE